jgi:hypothetical protein
MDLEPLPQAWRFFGFFQSSIGQEVVWIGAESPAVAKEATDNLGQLSADNKKLRIENDELRLELQIVRRESQPATRLLIAALSLLAILNLAVFLINVFHTR